MTVYIPRSAAGPNFEVEVAEFAANLKHWRGHMKRVEEDAANSVPRAEAHQAYNQPRARALVEAAVNENDVADYEIVEDGPTQDQILRAKKNELLQIVSRLEHEAICRIIPAGKMRLFNLRENDIRVADCALSVKISADVDRERARVERERSVISKIANAVGLAQKASDTVNVAATVEASRSVEDTKHLADQQSRRDAIAAVQREAAQAQHDIEDLTSETIDAWQMPKFSEG